MNGVLIVLGAFFLIVLAMAMVVEPLKTISVCLKTLLLLPINSKLRYSTSAVMALRGMKELHVFYHSDIGEIETHGVHNTISSSEQLPYGDTASGFVQFLFDRWYIKFIIHFCLFLSSVDKFRIVFQADSSGLKLTNVKGMMDA